jgi:hypothetical protein
MKACWSRVAGVLYGWPAAALEDGPGFALGAAGAAGGCACADPVDPVEREGAG